MRIPIIANDIYYCDICHSKLKINDGGFWICPKHCFEEFGIPPVASNAAQTHSHYESFDDRLIQYFNEHEDEI